MKQPRPVVYPLLQYIVITLLISSLGTGAWTCPALADEKPLSVPAVVAKVRPSVVTILTRGMPAAPSLHATQSGSGSGIVIDATGYILTNSHVVEAAE